MLSTAGLVLSVLLYLVTAWLIGRRVVTTPIAANDVTPDTWILMGALAINALAGVRLRGALKSQTVWTWFGRRHAPGDPRAVGGCERVDPGLAERRDLAAVSPSRFRTLRRCVVVGGLPAGYVFDRHAGHRSGAAPVCADHSLLVVFWVGFSVWVLVAAAFAHLTVRAAWGVPRRG